MANKNRYYGLATNEQKELKSRATRTPFINVEELTPYTVYSAVALAPELDKMLAPTATKRMKEVLIANGFKGKLTVEGSHISDELNDYVLTKSVNNGLMIVKETHEKKKR